MICITDNGDIIPFLEKCQAFLKLFKIFQRAISGIFFPAAGIGNSFFFPVFCNGAAGDGDPLFPSAFLQEGGRCKASFISSAMISWSSCLILRAVTALEGSSDFSVDEVEVPTFLERRIHGYTPRSTGDISCLLHG